MASRNDIPQTVADGIVQALVSLDRNQWFSPYATVSRHFQKAIEAQTFRELYLTSARLDELQDKVTRERQKYVQVLTLHVALASYKKWQREDRESQNDVDQTTRVFTTSVQELFATVSKWNPSDGSPGGIHLELLVESPSDESVASSRRNSPSTTRRARKSATGFDFYSGQLPGVHVVSAFTCSGTGRHIELETVSHLLDKFPNLRLLDAELEHDTNDEKDLEQRKVFALGLEHRAPHVTDLRFRRPHTTPEARKAASSNSRSLFYNIITRYTQRCMALSFDDCIDVRDFLAPFDDGEQREQQRPYWPYLERLHVRNSFLMRRPYMRVKTRAQAVHQIDRIFLLVGRAVRFMPMVNNIKIRLYVYNEGRLEQTNVQYDAWNGGARIRFTGTPPTKASLDAWKTSVTKAQGVELQVL